MAEMWGKIKRVSVRRYAAIRESAVEAAREPARPLHGRCTPLPPLSQQRSP